jgi:branched-chain amino acid transport system permease protein
MAFLEAGEMADGHARGLEPVQLASVQGMLTGLALLLILRLRPQGMLPERIRPAPATP